MLKRMSHVMMFTTDLARALAWYEEKLGFRRIFVVPGAYASLEHPSAQCRLDLHPTELGGQDVGHGPMPYFAVSDLDAALAKLKASGVKVSEARREGNSPRFASLWDADGNALGLQEDAST
jgi:catechol 2,3-dioxygenase-like lactoylglutathione lyase family enzyme